MCVGCKMTISLINRLNTLWRADGVGFLSSFLRRMLHHLSMWHSASSQWLSWTSWNIPQTCFPACIKRLQLFLCQSADQALKPQNCTHSFSQKDFISASLHKLMCVGPERLFLFPSLDIESLVQFPAGLYQAVLTCKSLIRKLTNLCRWPSE